MQQNEWLANELISVSFIGPVCSTFKEFGSAAVLSGTRQIRDKLESKNIQHKEYAIYKSVVQKAFVHIVYISAVLYVN